MDSKCQKKDCDDRCARQRDNLPALLCDAHHVALTGTDEFRSLISEQFVEQAGMNASIHGGDRTAAEACARSVMKVEDRLVAFLRSWLEAP